MAEFVQMMKDWRRMCQFMDKEYGNSSCDKCPLGGCSAVYEMCGKENFTNMERDISAWAAEHPEPIYPTWSEWLYEQGVLGDKIVCNVPIMTAHNVATEKVDEPIPDDIAQKLGINPKPKEG